MRLHFNNKQQQLTLCFGQTMDKPYPSITFNLMYNRMDDKSDKGLEKKMAFYFCLFRTLSDVLANDVE